MLNVHGAVACGEMCMEQLHVHVIRMCRSLTEVMTLKYTGALHCVEAVRQVCPGPRAVSVFEFLVLC